MIEISNRHGRGIFSPHSIIKIVSPFIFILVLTSGNISASGAGQSAQSGIQSIQYEESDNTARVPDETDGHILPDSDQEPPVDITDPDMNEPAPDGSEPEYYQYGDVPADNAQGEEFLSDPEGPLVDEPYPLVDDPEPLVESTEPLVARPAPLVEQSSPLVDQNPPLVNQPAPLVRQPAPLVRQSRPLVNQPAPLVRQSSPLVNQPAPLVRQPAPLVNQSAPLVR